MKALKFLVTLFIFFVQPVIGTAGGGQEKPLPGIADTYTDIKTIRVVVEQSYGVKHSIFVVLYKVKLSFFEVSKEVLEGYGGIQVFADGPEPVDAVLLIKAKGKAIGEDYSTLQDAMRKNKTTSYHYSGADLSGELLLTAGQRTINGLFNGKVSTPSSIHGSIKDPNNAPFKQAFLEFYPAIMQLLFELRGIDPLLPALKNENRYIRWGAAITLGKSKDSRSVEPLIAALNDNERDVHVAAAESLGELGDPRAVEPLLDYFDRAVKGFYEKPSVAAAHALGKLGDPRAIEPLINSLGTREWVTFPAMHALEKLTGKKFDDDDYKEKYQKWWKKNKKKLLK